MQRGDVLSPNQAVTPPHADNHSLPQGPHLSALCIIVSYRTNHTLNKGPIKRAWEDTMKSHKKHQPVVDPSWVGRHKCGWVDLWIMCG